jgi:short-subunit dehydrogenase
MTAANRSTALITGASGGIGRELAELFAQDGWDLVLVARSADKLADVARNLEERREVRCVPVPADLADPGAPATIVQAVAERGLALDALVNNAGFGLRGAFVETDFEREREMIQLNVVALTHLTKLVLPGMLARGKGRILNVASLAGFTPGPGMAVYYATKAYVLSFSEALATELAGRGVTVTVLAPGPTVTGFGATAGAGDSRLFKGPMVKDVRFVARAGYEGMLKGKRIVIPGFMNKALVQSLRVSPRAMIARIAQLLNA